MKIMSKNDERITWKTSGLEKYNENHCSYYEN